MAARAVNCSGVNAGSSVAPRNVHLHGTARRSEAMLSFRIPVGGSPLPNLSLAVPDRPVLRIVPAWRTEILIVPTLKRSDRHAQYLGRGVSTDAVWITPGTVDSKLVPAGFRESVNVDGHGRLQRLFRAKARSSRYHARPAWFSSSCSNLHSWAVLTVSVSDPNRALRGSPAGFLASPLPPAATPQSPPAASARDPR